MESSKSSASPRDAYISDPGLNFDYLNFLDDETDYSENPCTVNENKEKISCPKIEDESTISGTPLITAERILGIIDGLDASVENFRRDALNLLETRDYLLTSVAIIQENDEYQNLKETEREEITSYIKRVNCRLATVDINVQTIRDQSQQDSLYKINDLIDHMIKINDPTLARQQCQQYLNVCGDSNNSSPNLKPSVGLPDKNFESALLGCTLDDQKIVKKRLTALMNYLNQQNTQTKLNDK